MPDGGLAVPGGGAMLGLAAALLLGARHATDPDHLAAVSTLVVSDGRQGGSQAGTLGLFWGLGHATTLLLCGLPVVMFGAGLPPSVAGVAEFLVGVITAALAVRLLQRWRRGCFHPHPHRYGRVHDQPHVHAPGHSAERPDESPHRRHQPGRSPAEAFGIGLVHGVGGSAGVGILVVASIADRGHAVVSLLLFALATAASMAVVSGVVGYSLARRPVTVRLERVAPAVGAASLLFGVWYALQALAAMG